MFDRLKFGKILTIERLLFYQATNVNIKASDLLMDLAQLRVIQTVRW